MSIDAELDRLASEIVADATTRHHERAIDYWNGLRLVLEWWDELPPEQRTHEPFAIAKARRLIR